MLEQRALQKTHSSPTRVGDLITIKKLVFSGAGVKGLAYVSALDKLAEFIDLTQIDGVAGTSAGSIVAALLACGLNNQQILEKLEETQNLVKYLDNAKSTTVSKELKLVNASAKKKKSKAAIKGLGLFLTPEVKSNLKHHGGIHDGHQLREDVEKWIYESVSTLQDNISCKNLTFSELHDLTLQFPGTFRDLKVIARNVQTGHEELFSFETSPHVVVSYAVRASFALPGVFKESKVAYKLPGEVEISFPNSTTYSDGGELNNFPIRVFDVQYTDGYGIPQTETNPSVLGFRMVKQKTKDYYEGRTTEKPKLDGSGIIGRLAQRVKGSLKKQESDFDAYNDKFRTIFIDSCDVPTADFNLNAEHREKLLSSGSTAVLEFFTGSDQRAINIAQNAVLAKNTL